MDITSLKFAHQSLLDSKPQQFAAMLEIVSHGFEQLGFKSLIEYVHADVGKGGLGLTDNRLNALLWFNPGYKHKAEELSKKMGLPELAKGIEAIGKHGVNQYSGDSISGNRTSTKPGTSKKYLIAKLKRDHPKVAKNLENGAYKNVTEAWRVAKGLPALKRTKRIHIDLDDKENSYNESLAELMPGWRVVKVINPF